MLARRKETREEESSWTMVRTSREEKRCFIFGEYGWLRVVVLALVGIGCGEHAAAFRSEEGRFVCREKRKREWTCPN